MKIFKFKNKYLIVSLIALGSLSISVPLIIHFSTSQSYKNLNFSENLTSYTNNLNVNLPENTYEKKQYYENGNLVYYTDRIELLSPVTAYEISLYAQKLSAKEKQFVSESVDWEKYLKLNSINYLINLLNPYFVFKNQTEENLKIIENYLDKYFDKETKEFNLQTFDLDIWTVFRFVESFYLNENARHLLKKYSFKNSLQYLISKIQDKDPLSTNKIFLYQSLVYTDNLSLIDLKNNSDFVEYKKYVKKWEESYNSKKGYSDIGKISDLIVLLRQSNQISENEYDDLINKVLFWKEMILEKGTSWLLVNLRDYFTTEELTKRFYNDISKIEPVIRFDSKSNFYWKVLFQFDNEHNPDSTTIVREEILKALNDKKAYVEPEDFLYLLKYSDNFDKEFIVKNYLLLETYFQNMVKYSSAGYKTIVKIALILSTYAKTPKNIPLQIYNYLKELVSESKLKEINKIPPNLLADYFFLNSIIVDDISKSDKELILNTIRKQNLEFFLSLDEEVLKFLHSKNPKIFDNVQIKENFGTFDKSEKIYKTFLIKSLKSNA
ncbi:hypothetical protein [Mycoplasmopsis columboralis]|uniref:Uncharacterized protein n=1 Tax=Mycoplasmopsis columboralis TaxID=171282 RepID=A0A449B7C2_9BACT|nr:hypothetical protein [Mycoplasmopsis columboralis]VEU76485.1 Uncharacterised protein [Mycoplasmopsis columboralis]